MILHQHDNLVVKITEQEQELANRITTNSKERTCFKVQSAYQSQTNPKMSRTKTNFRENYQWNDNIFIDFVNVIELEELIN